MSRKTADEAEIARSNPAEEGLGGDRKQGLHKQKLLDFISIYPG
jgi:hypothetical protein